MLSCMVACYHLGLFVVLCSYLWCTYYFLEVYHKNSFNWNIIWAFCVTNMWVWLVTNLMSKLNSNVSIWLGCNVIVYYVCQSVNWICCLLWYIWNAWYFPQLIFESIWGEIFHWWFQDFELSHWCIHKVFLLTSLLKSIWCLFLKNFYVYCWIWF